MHLNLYYILCATKQVWQYTVAFYSTLFFSPAEISTPFRAMDRNNSNLSAVYMAAHTHTYASKRNAEISLLMTNLFVI